MNQSMNLSINLKKIKAAALKHEERLKDGRTLRVLRFLQAKGFFYSKPPPKWRGKISFRDAYWVARHVEPRVFEVLPAAALRFPGHFSDKPPAELKQVLSQLTSDDTGDFEFNGYKAANLRRFLTCPLRDQRSKSNWEQKTIKSFRISQKTASALSRKAKQLGKSESKLVEDLLKDLL